MRRGLSIVHIAVTAFSVVAGSTSELSAAGYWNMPGTLAQRTGHGYGGGYHAPFILGPIQCDGWRAPNEVRLPCPPCPHCPYMYGCDCGCGRTMEAPSTIEDVVPVPQEPSAAKSVQSPVMVQSKVVAPAASVVVRPAARAAQPLFDPPVQP
jgi:hypothetical protein